MKRLGGKVAIITGAGSGIGRACARAMAAEGARVYHTDINPETGRETDGLIAQDGGRSCFAVQDVCDEHRWEEVFADAGNRFGPVNVLVNNAGIALAGAIIDYPYETWKKQMAVNLDSVFLGTRAAIRAMSGSAGGSIINISSLAAFGGASVVSGYCTSKGAVCAFTKSAAVECAEAGYDIRVNSVHPGIIDTPMHHGITEDGADALGKAAAPMGRAGTPMEVASTVIFLASDDSSYTTGNEFVVDGGMWVRL